MARTRQSFVGRLRGILGGPLDDAAWEEIEETLIAADMGAGLASRVVEGARAQRDLDPELAVKNELIRLFAPRRTTGWPHVPGDGTPAVVLVVGVNGTGKTTTVAKLGHRFSKLGAKVLLAAADTFRAAAIEQLSEWAKRVDLPLVAHAAGADPSAVVYDALDAAAARGSDAVVIDTAGRLHTKSNLMDELEKIHRVAGKKLPGAPHDVWLVLDATTGQNAIAQAEIFHKALGVTGIILTKLDGTAKGGIVAGICHQLKIPIRFIGIGEKVDDLRPFDAGDFVEALFG